MNGQTIELVYAGHTLKVPDNSGEYRATVIPGGAKVVDYTWFATEGADNGDS